MGNFMDFSCSHSSTVALIQNLHTGYISPQYHVVFDGKFKTVFNDGKTPEEIDKLEETRFRETVNVMWRRSSTKAEFLCMNHSH